METVKIIRAKQVLAMIGNPHRTTLMRWVQAGTFPKPVRLGPNSIGWHEGDILKWIESRKNTPRWM